jgi:hypothetical protein
MAWMRAREARNPPVKNKLSTIKLTRYRQLSLSLAVESAAPILLTPALDVVDQLFGGVRRLHSAFVPLDWLLKWSSCSR